MRKLNPFFVALFAGFLLFGGGLCGPRPNLPGRIPEP
jgi:hypothetical protein